MKESWTKYITPVLVTIAIFMLGSIMAQVGRVDEKLFHHPIHPKNVYL